ncbi:hypothetical protein EDB86DRAFT_3201769 [Lactarius hatsudake]|nr:hypothetical protein EDB86DRAFT_3201769 [Lactarius hatsudake]
MFDLELVFKDDAGIKHKSKKIKKGHLIHWNLDIYVRTHTSVTLTIRQISLEMIELLNWKVVVFFLTLKTLSVFTDSNHRVTVNFVCGRSKSLADITRVLDSPVHTALASKVNTLDVPKNIIRSLQLPQLAAPPHLIPKRPVLYTPINMLNDDVLLSVFDYYRLDDENGWNVRLGWCKLSHACQRWRHLVYSSAFHLGVHIQCTNGTPRVETLGHLPPFPLFVDYRCATASISGQDESGIYHALLLRDRVRRIVLHLPPLIFHKFLMLVDEPFPILEYLSLSSTIDEDTSLVLPETFLAPNLSHLTLFGVGLPRGLSLLSPTVSLTTLTLMNIRASGYILPGQLVARLRSLPQLEDLSIGFSIPMPRPSAERVLLGEQGTPATLPNLRHLTFQGVSAYLECLVAQIRSPLLERLNITLFNQIAFALPHLSHFTNITEGLKLPNAKVIFRHDGVSIIMDHHSAQHHHRRFLLRVMCKQLDWQIDCATQICSVLMPALSSVERLALDSHSETIPIEFQNGEIDSTMWHELLGSFIWVKELRICRALLEELSLALQVDGVGSGLLPDLQKLACGDGVRDAKNMFSLFLDARRVAGRPVLLLKLPPTLSPLVIPPTWTPGPLAAHPLGRIPAPRAGVRPPLGAGKLESSLESLTSY